MERGGNVEGAKLGEVVTTANGVKIAGYANMPGRMAATASSLYAKNLYAFVETMIDKSAKALAELRRRAREGDAAHAGRRHRPSELREQGLTTMATPAELLQQAEEARAAAAAALAKADAAIAAVKAGAVSAGTAASTALGVDPIVYQFAIFVMAIFVGYYASGR